MLGEREKIKTTLNRGLGLLLYINYQWLKENMLAL